MTAIEDAQARARRIYPKSRGFRNAYLRGARCAMGGGKIESCPYSAEGGGSWTPAWRLAWVGGFLSVPPEVGEG